MKIIISPAKTMTKFSLESECGSLEEIFAKQQGCSLPRFLLEAAVLRDEINKLSLEEQQGLWKCNDELARINHERFDGMNLEEDLSPAVFCYEGIQYKTMDPKSLDGDSLKYLDEKLRILSGFYGVLKPFDGIAPYRLEMQAKLKGKGFKNVYDFWGSKLAQGLEAELDSEIELGSELDSELELVSELESGEESELKAKSESELKADLDLKAKPESDVDSELDSEIELGSETYLKECLEKQSIILNLASNEYSKAVAKHLKPETKLVTISFGEIKDGKFKQKATLAKMARGAMVRFMAQNKVESLEKLKKFRELDLNYNEELSTEDNLFFTI